MQLSCENLQETAWSHLILDGLFSTHEAECRRIFRAPIETHITSTVSREIEEASVRLDPCVSDSACPLEEVCVHVYKA